MPDSSPMNSRTLRLNRRILALSAGLALYLAVLSVLGACDEVLGSLVLR